MAGDKYDYLREELRSVTDVENDNLKKVLRERNVALIVDFASNLASVLSRSRGGRYPVITNNAERANERLIRAQERISSALRDYSGRKAALAFKELLDKGSASYVSGELPDLRHRPVFLKNSVVLRPGLVKEPRPKLLANMSLRKGK